MKKDKIIIAYVCDDRYVPYLKKSMESIRRYNKKVDFVILTDKPFEIEGAKVHNFNPDRELFKFKDKDRMEDGVYYKFYLPLLPYDKILFIDCDMICQRPLKTLWDTDCSFICGTESHNYGKIQAQDLGLKKYCLTSMMLMNLKELRKANFTQVCLDKLKEVDPQFHDETIINLCFNDKICFIDKKYNYCRNRVYDNPIPESDAYFLHYIGKQKKDMLSRTNFDDMNILQNVFMKGAKVAIVGNSSSLLEKNQGKEIDKHDFVIRFNKGFPNDKVGYKTDLLFLACTLKPQELMMFGNCMTVRRSKLCQNLCSFKLFPLDRIQLAQTATKYLKEYNPTLNACQASTGFIAINLALSSKCKSIDLYGFDFFDKPTYYNPKDYKTLHNGEKEREKVLEYAECGLLKIK